jgi:hypothetical protein
MLRLRFADAFGLRLVANDIRRLLQDRTGKLRKRLFAVRLILGKQRITDSVTGWRYCNAVQRSAVMPLVPADLVLLAVAVEFEDFKADPRSR